MNKKVLIFLILIVILASFLRLWRIGEAPISPDWDEVALGYNAYSILHTGRDEYGKFLPFVFQSFNDYKPALYAYLTIPFIAILDLTVVAVRLPSAIFGILSVLALFFLVKEIFKKDNIALLSSLLLAISPWHIQFSRVGFESNVGLAFNIFAILFFLKGLRKPKYLILSVILFALNIYVYQSEKAISPLFLFLLMSVFSKQFFSSTKKILLTAFLVGFVIALPMFVFIVTNKESLLRAQGVSIFSDRTTLQENVQRQQYSQNINDKIGSLLNNRRIEFAKVAVSGYISHFDLNWLFTKGDSQIDRHHVPNMGLMYIFELPFLLIGIYSFLFNSLGLSYDNKTKYFLLGWILLAPIPAAFTTGVPHSVRTINFLPVLQILTAFGLLTFITIFLQSIKSGIIRKTILLFLAIIILLNLTYYLDQYFVQQNYYYAKDWQYGYKELIDYLKPQHKQYNKIIVSNKVPMDQSYMFFLFYLKYDPKKYLSEGGTNSGKLEEKGNRFANFEFRKFDYSQENEKNILLIGSPSDFLQVYKTIYEVYYPDKTLAIKVVEKK